MAAALPTAIRVRTRAGARRTRRAAVRTAPRSRGRLNACGWNRARRVAPFGSFRVVTGFYFVGGALAAWALLVSALGVMREDFPRTPGAARLVGAVSVLLVVAAVGTAIYLSATEEHPPKGEHTASQ